MVSGMKVWVEIPSGLEASEDAVDIVAIHGIGADPDTTWGGRDSKGQRLNWLKDANMLPEAVPAARIMRFGYQSAWVDSETERGKTTFVSDIARMLLSDLASHRHNITRPIIFLAHSYGGLVLMQALRASHDDPDRWQNVFAYSAGLVFFGTPFRGRSGLTVSEMVKAIMENNKSSNIFSETMKLAAADNPHLRDIFSRFTEIRRRDNPIPVWCFYETLPSPISKVLKNEKVENGYLVTEESACLDTSKGVERYPLDRHHYNLQKFSGPHDPEYRPVKEAIQQLARGAREFLAPQAFDPAFKAALDEFLAQLHVTDPHLDKQRIQTTKGGLLADSFVWILRHERFTTFLNDTQGHQLLWIKGDPGKGKTMLLCGIVDHLKETSRKQPCYFFCQAGDERLNSAVAVLRSLIYLLVRQCPSLFSYAKDKYKYDKSGFFENVNTWFALSEIFLNMLNDPAARDAILIVDALDECTTQREELLKLITQAAGVRWIVASRGWPEIREHLAGRLMIELELEATSISEAVGIFIDYRVEQLAKRKGYSSDRKESVRKHLHSNANDTFLWVALVCQELEKRPRWQAEKSWETLPPGLNGLYERMLKQIDTQSDPDLCRDVLATVSLAKRPLTMVELSALLLPREGLGLDDLYEEIDSCGSFLTMTRRDGTGTVHYVHQSATDYILGDGAGRVFSTTESDHHYVLFSRSMTALSSSLKKDMYGLKSPGSFIGEVTAPNPDPLAPIRYSCVHWMDHLSEVRLGDGQKKALQNNTILAEFLQTKFLFWLEALSLLHDLPKGVSAVSSLQGLVGPPVENADTAGFPNVLYDAVRFIRHSLHMMEDYPLQVYVSALVFAPTKTIVRNLYKPNQPSWMTMQPRMDENWSACFQTFEVSTTWVTSVAWSQDGKWIASADYEGLIKLWDPMTGALLRSFCGHNNGISSVAFSPVDSSRLASRTINRDVKLWDLTDVKCLQKFYFPDTAWWLETQVVAFSSDGRRLAGAGRYGTRVWESQTTKHVYILEGTGCVDVAFSPDNQFIATGGERSYGLKLWDASTGAFLRNLDGGTRDVWAVAFSTNGKRLAWGDGDGHIARGDVYGNINVWDVDSWTFRYKVQHYAKIESISFSADDQRLAAAFGDGLVRVYNAETGSQIQTLRGHSSGVSSVVFSPDDSRQLASASSDGTIKIWHLDNNTQSSLLQEDDESEEDEGRVTSITLSKDGSRLLSMTGSSSVTCKLWDASTGKFLQMLTRMSGCTKLSSDGQWLAAVEFESPSVQMWDLTAMRCIQTLEHDSPVKCLAFSNDIQRLAVGTDDHKTKIWNVRQGICLQVLVNHFMPINDSIELVSFSPDGQRLASMDEYHIRIWDLDNGRCVKRYMPNLQSTPPGFLGWSADGQWFIMTSPGTTVIILPINENHPSARVQLSEDVYYYYYHDYHKFATMTADNRWIAIGSSKLLGVWNLETGQCAWRRKVSYKMSELSFDPTCSNRLFTNTGVIEFDLPSTSTHHDSNAGPLRLHRIGYGISFDGQWIMRGDERMLKLPVEYRGTPVDVARTKDGLEHVVAIGCKTGRVIIMRFK